MIQVMRSVRTPKHEAHMLMVVSDLKASGVESAEMCYDVAAKSGVAVCEIVVDASEWEKCGEVLGVQR